MGLQAEQIFSVNIFFNFGRGFCGSFPMLFPKVPAFCCKKIFELIFATLYFYINELQNCVLNLFQTRDINIFVLRGVIFSRYVQLKNYFPEEENISG